jgi:large subunit ribosomal protein L31
MKTDIHPKYMEATVTCQSCATTWTTRSTKPELKVELCSACHPFYTGQQRIVDTAGQIERFNKRLSGAQTEPRRKKAERRQEKLDQRQRMRSTQEQLLVVGDDDEESTESS